MKMSRCWGCACVVLLLGAGPARAGEEAAGPYTLLHPVPRELMRELSPDRPDTTESPITVDAGHVQVETSLVGYARDRYRGQRADSWTLLDTNVKLGLDDRDDIQFVFAPYGIESERGGGRLERVEGAGDLTIRWKRNIWGNDGKTRTAFGLMPFVTIPTGGALSAEEPAGGLITVLGCDLTERVGVAFMAEFDAVHDAEAGRHRAELVHTATCGFDVVGPLGAYVEYIGVSGLGWERPYEALFSAGLTWAIGVDVLLDCGTRVGLTEEAEDVAVFAGLTWRY